MEEPVWMAISDLDEFQQVLLPMGCGIRTYHSGDEWHWLYIVRQANPGKQYRNASFSHAFASHIGELPRRLFFLVNAQGKDIGTAAALPDGLWRDAATGCLCHVALLPEGQSHMASLVRAALERMRRLGHSRAYVQSGPGVVDLYASLGFRPIFREDGDKKRWEKIRASHPWPEDREFSPIAEQDWIGKANRK